MIARSLVTLSVFAFAVAAQPPTTPPKPAPTKPAAAKPAAPKPAVAAAPVAPPKPAREPGLYATLYITHGVAPMGTITFKLYEKESPITVKNFVDLAQGRKEWLNPKTGTRVKLPLFNGLTFHRVIPDFMIQGGDPLGNGTGGTDPIPDEFHPSLRLDIPGRVAMANAGFGTGSSQFFITETPQDRLTGKHTIFGQVVEGLELVGKIARVPRGPGDKPDVPVKMSRVVITRVADPNAPKPVAPAVKKAAPAVKKAAPAAAPAAAKKG
jgi:peptidyl-prolyl cis-trans isomerase A (cyclophilin A)